MPPTIPSNAVDSTVRFDGCVRWLAALAFMIGVLVLVGWTFDLTTLKGIRPGLATMKPKTALALMFAAGSLALMPYPPRKRLGQLLAGVTVALAVSNIIQDQSGLNFGTDDLLFTQAVRAEGQKRPGQMAPVTAINFCLLGVGLIFAHGRNRRLHSVAQILAVTASLTSMFALLGYAYGAESLYCLSRFSSVALHSAVGFVFLIAGLFLARPNQGLMGLATSPSLGGLMIRRLLPALILILVFFGWVRLAGQRAGLYEAPIGVVLLVMANIIGISILIFWTAFTINHADQQRLQAEIIGRESEARYRVLTEVSPSVIWASRPDGFVTYCNPYWHALTGLTIDENLGDGWNKALHPDDRAVVLEHWRTSANTGKSYEAEFRIRRHDGEYRWLFAKGLPLMDPGGRLVQWMGVALDVTELKIARDELRRAHDELDVKVRERAGELVEVNRKLSASLAEKEVLLREIHHRVKNNLQVVSALLQLQAAQCPERKVQVMFEESQQRVRSMALVHERLYRSHDLARVNFGDYLRSLCESLRLSYRAVDVDIRVESEHADLALDQAIPCGLLVNELVSNCFKHAFPEGGGGRIRIGLDPIEARAGMICLRVQDNGVGLPSGVKGADSFGLRLVDALVEQLHGSLAMTNGDGTTVEVIFPLSLNP